MKGDHWHGYSDYWDDFEFKTIVETIWNGYRDKTEELALLLKQLDDSKSIFTLPYQLEKRWLRLVWDAGAKVSRPVTGEQLLDIPELVDDNYMPAGVSFTVDRELNAVVLDEPADEALKLWAPVYFVHNPVIESFWMPLLGLGDLAEHFETVYQVKPYSGTFYRIIKGLWYVFVAGPTIKNISVGLSILFNIPVALRPGVISRIETSGMTTTLELIPDEKVGPPVDKWVFSSNFNCPFQVGDRVELGTTLVDAVSEVLDYLNSPGWWQFIPEDQVKKMELIEKYCTTLIKVSAENYFADRIAEEQGRSQDFLQEYVGYVLPDYVNLMLLLFNSWTDQVEEPSDYATRSMKINWFDALGKDAGCVTSFKDDSESVNQFVKHDGVFPFREGPVLRNHLEKKHVIRSKGRIFLPDDIIIDGVRLASGSPVSILSRGEFWIDIDYTGLDDDVIVEHRILDYDRVGGKELWVKEVHIQEWAYAHAYDSKTKKLTILGEDVNQILGVKVPSVMFGPADRELVHGVDYEIKYNRFNLGEGTIDILFLNEEHREVYVKILTIPCYPVPLDEFGEESRVEVEDTLTIKVRIADVDSVVYDRGRWYFGDQEVFIGDEIPIYDGTYNYDGEIDFGEESDGHFYLHIITA